MVWQWQRNRDRRNRRGGNDEPRVAEAGAQAEDRATRHTDRLSDPEFVSGLRPIPAGSEAIPAPWPASDIIGVSPSGEAIKVRLADHEGRLLLAFLDTECDGCEEFWRGLRNPDATGFRLAPPSS